MDQVTVALNTVLHENQLMVHEHPARNKAVLAGKRFGKTKWLLYELCRAAGLARNKMFWYVAPTYGQAESIAWRELKNMIPPQVIRQKLESKLSIEFITGSTLRLLGTDYEDSLRGPKLDGLGMDECDYVKEDIYPTILAGQLLGVNGEEPGFAYFISSPNGKGASWFPKFVQDKELRSRNGDDKWGAFRFTIYDNPLLTKEHIQEIKDGCSDEKWNLEYMAIPSLLAGQLYHEFARDRNVAEYKGDKLLPVVRGLDWGINHPTSCEWAKIDVENEKIYVYEELIKSDLVIQELAARINQMTGNTAITATVCDPSMNKRNSQTLRTDMLEFSRYGVPCVAGDNRDRGRDIMKMMLKQGKLAISPRCRTLIYELENLQYGQDIGDDASDACRYLCLWVHDRFPGWKKMNEPMQSRVPTQFFNINGFHDRPATQWEFYTDKEDDLAVTSDY